MRSRSHCSEKWPPVRKYAAIERWTSANATAVERYMGMLADIKASRSYDLTTLPVALREGRNLLPRG